MKFGQYAEDKMFWKLLEFLCLQSGRCRIEEVTKHFKAEKDFVKSVILFLKTTGYPIELINLPATGVEEIIFPEKTPEMSVKLSHFEWLALQGHFPYLKGIKDKPFYKPIADVYAKIEMTFPQYDLFQPLDVLEKTLIIKRSDLEENNVPKALSVIEDALLKRVSICIRYQNKEYQVYPHRLIHLEGKLTLIGEDLQDQLLMSFDIDHLETVKKSTMSETPHFLRKEVDKFISEIRNFSHHEVRLVFKLLHLLPQDELAPKYHFFRNPCLIASPNGEFVWAAHVEPGDELFQWMYDLKDSIEILDPISLKEDFASFCARRLKKSA